MTINPKPFFDGYHAALGSLTQGQVDGLNELLGLIAADSTVTDARHLAYMLATVKHETAGTFKPIAEYGRGKGRAYGRAVAYTAPDGTVYRNTYYGRGYVQLTWLGNYRRLGERVGVGDLFARDPDAVMQPRHAFAIMVAGMTEGLFTGEKLADYINGGRCDYRSARRIINRMDRAELIADYARKFETILRTAITHE